MDRHISLGCFLGESPTFQLAQLRISMIPGFGWMGLGVSIGPPPAWRVGKIRLKWTRILSPLMETSRSLQTKVIDIDRYSLILLKFGC